MIQMRASVHKVSVDSDGEATVTLKVPQADLTSALSVGVLTDKVLIVSIAKEDSDSERAN